MPYQRYRVSGEDAITFLQGQLTQDIQSITADNVGYGAYCTPKGRMLANFLIGADTATNSITLQLHSAVADSVIKRLQMFILRAKVTLLPSQETVVGLNAAMAEQLCQQTHTTLPDAFQKISTETFSLVALPNGYYEALFDSTPMLPAEAENFAAVNALRIRSGNFHILPPTSEAVLPQQTTLATWGGINYEKGCYVGQEIIARNKYRGTVKKGLAVATLDGDWDLPVGATIKQNGKNAGQLLETQTAQGKTVCLALIYLDMADKPCQLETTEPTFVLL